ncbi:MAG TPA: hypothetical protein DCY64_08555 [Hydrogenophaga sp.]|uniref:hypothetical protein n=1 Tax=Hydrogenophaga sp. TaxID=1904254 RepID=UPI0008CC9607|nr:hypothetical protein [Hydrogenophaga sp.]OGA73873.1 MAG: hypothetical protein A2X73_23800 [Burkholderiales bacterium GWE1_65_30]OGA91787.1 MAG: hypothetical protein A2X72_07875 [Burkholderiales bacterium GWF1_66_17]HAX20318.1 hypothetical protein [Hydrogenophaga sp.]HBU18910.1 hypothetical protein [Hydrogenophaga sp.]
MFLTLQIDKVQPGLYRGAVMKSGGEVTEPVLHPSIADCIRLSALDVPTGFASFMEIHYGGMSSGTYLLADLPDKAEHIASHLVVLVATMHEIENGSEHAKSP